MAVQCLDDPGTIHQKEWCLSAVSKELKGTLTNVEHKAHQCHTPPCKTLKTVHQVKIAASTHAPCDSQPAHLLDGVITIERLVTVFDQDGQHRGFHAGDFVWKGSGSTQVNGRMSGVTNVGTHRKPAFTECQKCDDKGIMEGRLCGQISSTSTPALNGCQVMAAYRIKFDPSVDGGSGAITGTLEGVIICSCQQ